MAATILEAEGVECEETTRCLAELIVSLSDYREEGAVLFPVVIVTDDLSFTKRLLQSWMSIRLGKGNRSGWTIREALKRTAPLTIGNTWFVYLQRGPDGFEYGVLASPSSPVASSPSETIHGIESGPLALLFRRIGDRAVEAVGLRRRTVIHLSAVDHEEGAPIEALEPLCRVASRQCEADIRDDFSNFLAQVLDDILQRGHGALIAVVAPESDMPPLLQKADGRADGIQLEEAIDVAAIYSMTRGAEALGQPEAGFQLASLLQLVEGMLSADGILLLDSVGRICGFNLFANQPGSTTDAEIIGGARRRAFEAMKHAVTNGDMLAAYMRSSDGASAVYVPKVGHYE